MTPLLLEEVRVDSLDLVGLLEGGAEVELDHEFGQAFTIDQDHGLVEVLHVLRGFPGEGSGGQDTPLFARWPVIAPTKAWTAGRPTHP